MTLRLYADQKKWPLQRVGVTVNHAKREAERAICLPVRLWSKANSMPPSRTG